MLASCKRKGVSVYSAAHAALVVATQNYACSATEGRNYTCVAAFNCRPYLPAPYNDSKAWPAGAYIVGPPATLPAADFLTQARILHQYYGQPVRKGETMLHDAHEMYSKKLLAAFRTPPPSNMPPATTPEMSNLGVVDKFVQAVYKGRHSVGLKDVEVAVDQIAQNLISYYWSFKGRLCLSVVFNEAVYADKWVEDFSRACKEHSHLGAWRIR